MGYANPKVDYADHSQKPDYAKMICPKPDNADYHYGPINVKYTPLTGAAASSNTLTHDRNQPKPRSR